MEETQCLDLSKDKYLESTDTASLHNIIDAAHWQDDNPPMAECHHYFRGVDDIRMLHIGKVNIPLMDDIPPWKTLEKDVPKALIVHRKEDVPQCLQLHVALGGLFQMTEQCVINHAEIGSCLGEQTMDLDAQDILHQPSCPFRTSQMDCSN